MKHRNCEVSRGARTARTVLVPVLLGIVALLSPMVTVAQGFVLKGGSSAELAIAKQIRLPNLNWMDANEAASAPHFNYPVGADYRIRLENTGDEALIDVTVSDPVLGLIGMAEVEVPPLVPGDIVYLVPEAADDGADATLDPLVVEALSVDVVCNEAGEFTNVAHVTGTTKAGDMMVMEEDAAVLVCIELRQATVEIIKEVRVPGLAWEDANDPGSAPMIPFPSDAEYRIRVENTGTTFLIRVTVNDPMLGLVGEDAIDVGNLAPGAVIYLLPQGEPNPPDATEGPIVVEELTVPDACTGPETVTNLATVVGTDKSNGEMVTDQDPAVLVCEGTEMCLVVIDEEGLDNDFRGVEVAAALNGVSPEELINDDQPTEFGNPPLLWNEIAGLGGIPVGDPRRLQLLPTGQVDDEGWYALPTGPNILYKDNSRPPNCGLAGGYEAWIDRFVAGTLPQHCLDEVLDVMPLRNQDLAQLVGRTCNAVVYDSDVSMNYKPIFGNLQGARLGLFSFTIVALEVAGSLPESGSDTSLYDLWLHVEPPAQGGDPVGFVVVRDHEPDSIEINRARCQAGQLEVRGESDRAPGALMTVSVDGSDAGSDPLADPFLVEEPMSYLGDGEYELVLDLAAVPEDCSDIEGRRLSIQTDEGGAYNNTVR